jgi:hypothetical protein
MPLRVGGGVEGSWFQSSLSMLVCSVENEVMLHRSRSHCFGNKREDGVASISSREPNLPLVSFERFPVDVYRAYFHAGSSSTSYLVPAAQETELASANGWELRKSLVQIQLRALFH